MVAIEMTFQIPLATGPTLGPTWGSEVLGKLRRTDDEVRVWNKGQYPRVR